jgi:hypothetical protein
VNSSKKIAQGGVEGGKKNPLTRQADERVKQ